METSQQIIREAPEIEAYKLGLLQQAKGLTQTPYQLPAYQVAGMAPQQLQAEQLAQAGIGAYQPYLQAAGQGISQGQDLAQAGARGVAGIDVSPEFGAAQRAMQAGVGTAGMLPQYAQAAGAGMPLVQAGSQAVGQAIGTAPQYMQAGLGQSQQMLQQAAGQTMGVRPDFRAAEQTIGAGIAGIPGATRGYSPDAALDYMNPYQQAVTQQALQEMQRQANFARQGAAAQAVGSGAFGGMREGVQRAELERNLQDVMSQRIMQDYAQNFAQAQQAAMTGFESQQQRQLAGAQGLGQLGSQLAGVGAQQAQLGLAGAQQLAGIGSQLGQQQLQQTQLGQAGTQLMGQLGAQQAQLGLLPAQIAAQQGQLAGQGAQLYGQLGQGIGALAGQQAGIGLQQGSTLGQLGQTVGTLGVQQAALGQAQQQMGMADIGMVSQLGGVRQANQQAQLDAARATQMQQTMAPYQQLGFLSDIYKGAPTSQMALTAGSAPSPSPMTQAVGLGIAGLTAASGAKQAGLFG
jgi:hypothetical protein